MHPLREYLKKNKIRIGIFCDSIGISRQGINNIFKYKNYPRRELAKKIEISTNGKVTAMELLYPENIINLSNKQKKTIRVK
ncbi:MAG: hypothetical protein ACYDDE_03985 [bacterium]